MIIRLKGKYTQDVTRRVSNYVSVNIKQIALQ